VVPRGEDVGRVASGQQHRVFVVELDDQFGPRRRADRPNLYVGTTIDDPELNFERMKRSSKRHRVVREHGVRLRQDLVASYPPTTAADIRRQKRKVIDKLMRKGFTVNGDLRVWRLYVIELEDTVGPRADPRYPWVYVGETSIDVDERIRQHFEEARTAKGYPLYSKWVYRHGLRPREDLYRAEPPQYTHEDALIAERMLGERLRAAGYSVKGAH